MSRWEQRRFKAIERGWRHNTLTWVEALRALVDLGWSVEQACQWLVHT